MSAGPEDDKQFTSGFQAVKDQLDALTKDMQTFNRLAQSGSDDPALTQQIRRKIQILDRDAKALNATISTASVSEKEKIRRRNLVADVLGKKTQFEAALKRPAARPGAGSGPAGFGSSGPGTATRGRWAQEDESTQGATSEDLLQLQNQIIQDQDRGLDVIAKSIARQKELGQAINRELTEQDPLLDKLDRHVDHTENAINKETKRVIKLTRAQAQGGALCCLVIVVIIFVALLVTDWGCKIVTPSKCS
eukprot:Amastigsp_a844606_19.p1 type:complete len:249 gc:universal Amastigsp_a844606_19:33-779(+)